MCIKAYASYHPTIVAEQIDDPKANALVEKTFSSERFVNQVIIYHLKGQYYKIRLLHNPEGRLFTSTKAFRQYPGGPLEPYSISWNCIYGIAADKVAPQELIDHLSKYTTTSWWDWYVNFTVHNGTYVEHTEHHYNYDMIYTLDTWFYFSEDFF